MDCFYEIVKNLSWILWYINSKNFFLVTKNIGWNWKTQEKKDYVIYAIIQKIDYRWITDKNNRKETNYLDFT